MQHVTYLALILSLLCVFLFSYPQSVELMQQCGHHTTGPDVFMISDPVAHGARHAGRLCVFLARGLTRIRRVCSLHLGYATL